MIKLGKEAGKFEYLLGCIYLNCEGVRMEENVEIMERVSRICKQYNTAGFKVIIGGDLNGHIWELDKCENGWYGKLIKSSIRQSSMELLNGTVDELNGHTWSMNDKEYTLDHVCVNERGLQCVKGAKILDIEEVVESDHAALDIFNSIVYFRQKSIHMYNIQNKIQCLLTIKY